MLFKFTNLNKLSSEKQVQYSYYALRSKEEEEEKKLLVTHRSTGNCRDISSPWQGKWGINASSTIKCLCCQLLVTWVPINVEVKLLVIPWYKQKLITCCFHSNTFCFEARSLDIEPNVTQKSLLSGSTIEAPNDNFW